MSERIQSFAEFWPFYVKAHAEPRNRRFHFIGTTLAILFVVAAVVTANAWWLVPVLPVGYGFSWVGHFGMQKNVPATFSYPLWSFRGDLKMWALIALGRMDDEVRRHAPAGLEPH